MPFNFLKLALILGLGWMISACAAVDGARGPFNGLSHDGARKVVCYKNPDYGPMTRDDYDTCIRQANFCSSVARDQLSGPETSGLAVAGPSAAAGAAGLAPAGAPGIGALSGGLQGFVNGVLVYSQANASFVGTCTGRNLEDRRTRRPGLHAAPALVESNNRTGHTPDWVVRGSAAPASTAAADNAAEDEDEESPQ